MDSDQSDDDQIITLDELMDEVEEVNIKEKIGRGQSEIGECSYEKGYVKRQGLFACKTCMEKGALPAVICYGCSVDCHADHELYELWTKRNHRCDCGNERFRGINVCSLNPNKDTINVKNNYDHHNLQNRYCSCDQVYGDEEKDMYWCVMCEDWFHLQHLMLDRPMSDDEDLICSTCSNRYMSILWPYYPLYAKSNEQEAMNLFTALTDIPKIERGHPGCILAFLANHIACNKIGKATDTEIVDTLQKVFDGSKSTLWSNEWRYKLCKCTECLCKYENEGVSFLVDPEDSMDHYLSVAKTDIDRCFSGYVKANLLAIIISSEGDKALRNTCIDDIGDLVKTMDRFQQVEFYALLNDFREQMRCFFEDHAKNGRIITASDVERFLAEMKERRDNSNMPPDRCHDIE